MRAQSAILFCASAVVLPLALLFNRAANAEDFHDYPCIVDCSGHEAGYNWADRKGINDPTDCGGTSQSFIEGCEAYAKEHSGDDDDQSNEDDDQKTDDDQSSESGDGTSGE